MRDHEEPGKPQAGGGQDGNPDGERGRGIQPGERADTTGKKITSQDEASGDDNKRQSGHQDGQPLKQQDR